MPFELSGENPTTGTGVYFPASAGQLYAYHGVHGRTPRGMKLQYAPELHEYVATEEAFRAVWQQGKLLSMLERDREGGGGHSSMIFATDVAAGDDQYVFLSIAEPHSIGHVGFHFVLDPYVLVRQGAVIGLSDLGTFFYGVLSERLRVKDRNDLQTWTDEQIEEFQERIRPVHDVWRISGQKAIDWLRWVQGERSKNPVSAKALRAAANAIDRKLGEHNIEYVAKDRHSARKAELLVPFELDLRVPGVLRGVIFRKNWIEVDDFVEVYGVPGTEPPPAIEPMQANMMPSSGNPARCPRCHDWMHLRPLEIPGHFSMYSWTWQDRMKKPGMEHAIMLMVCHSCGAAFGSGDQWTRNHDPFVDEEYLGQIDEFKKEPYRW